MWRSAGGADERLLCLPPGLFCAESWDFWCTAALDCFVYMSAVCFLSLFLSSKLYNDLVDSELQWISLEY
jgi:hypothetical protein